MDGGERARRLGSLFRAVGVESRRVRGLQILDRLLRLAEHEVGPAEVVQQTREVSLVVQFLVPALRALRIAAGPPPVAAARGAERSLDTSSGPHRGVVERLRQLECARDVLASGFEVALAAVA